MDREEERAILEAVLQGRKERFEVIVRHYQSQSFAVAMGLVKNRHDAMDLCQDAFLRAYRALKTFDLTQPFFPWFYRILRNVCLSHLKKRRKFFSLRARTQDDEETDISIPSEEAGPEALAERSELKDKFYKVFQTLPVRDREILTLRHFQHMAYADIAEALEIPVGTVMSRLFYARRKLKEKMGSDLE